MIQRIVLLIAALFCVAAAWAGTDAREPLSPEEAFVASARLVEPTVVEVRYRIADGHYLYRDKFRFKLAQPGAGQLRSVLPAGIAHEDEFFGKVQTYRGEAVARVMLEKASDAGVLLEAVSQGCADAGICYPPQTQRLRIESVATAPMSSGLLARLAQAAPAQQEEFLPVDKAFRVQARMPDDATVTVRFTPAEGYYLYRDKTTFAIPGTGAVSIESVQLPRGEMKKDPNFGDTEVFHEAFQAAIRLRRAAGDSSPFTLEVGYQGCSTKGLCYPPEKRAFLLVAGQRGDAPLAGAATTPADIAPARADQPQAEDQRVARLLGSGNLALIVASFLGFGLLLSLTPCMWPMIPILGGIIAGQQRPSRRRGLVLSLAYVLGLASAYAVAGVAAGLTGSLLSAALQNAWVLGAFAVAFVALSLAMFGLYDLQLPASLQSRLSEASGRLRGGTLSGVFLMGAISAVIVGPCVAAPLAGALLYISQSRDAVLGGTALFAMAVGMGLPLIAIGASAGALLPRAGPWMQSVKNVFGVLLLATAIWVATPILPVSVQMLLWAALLVVCAVFLRAIDALPPDASGWRKLAKGFGVLLLLLGIAMLVGALSGSRDVLRPLAGLRSANGPAVSDGASAFVRVANLAQLDAALASADRPVMLDFYADWCVSCKEMERFTFTDPRVKEQMQQMLLLQADVTANSAEDKALLARFGLFGPPGILFFDRTGSEIRSARVIGFQSADRFSDVLASVLGQ